MASTDQPRKILNVGLIGCGEVTQVVHIPTLSHLSDYFRITYLCDVSPSALEYCKSKIAAGNGPVLTTKNATELCAAEQTDIVMVATADEYHAAHAILGLEHGKYVFLEKPCALTKQDTEAIAEAERASKGSVMVGYMRRYAAPFNDAINEIGGLDKILYARVRDIIGPNSTFVSQSGTFPRVFTDISAGDAADKASRAQNMVAHALHKEVGGIEATPETTLMWRLLAGLGSHDLSVMREALGMPEKVVGTSLGFPFWNVLFKYPTFTVSYESGIDNIPRFDAHLEVYSSNKVVRIQYDTPYIKGLPVTLHIAENIDGMYRESTIRKSYEDPYTLEMKELWAFVSEGKLIKTTIADAAQDLELFSMILAHGYSS